jgi:threonine aldolase
VHVDGARFSQAVAHTMRSWNMSESAACRALTVDAGVDALSLGGTKGGLGLGEAIVLFTARSPAAARAAERMPYLRKSFGHLLSKHRFVSAQFDRVLENGAWIRHATHAAAAAEYLAAGLRARGVPPAFPRESNVVFADLPPALDHLLKHRGHTYYPFKTSVGPRARLMCSFATTTADLDAFLADVG